MFAILGEAMELIFNYQETENILVDFYNLTGFRIALFDAEFQEILAYPNRLSTFCKLVRADEELQNICKQSDCVAFYHSKKSGESLCYKCHMGMTEMIVPIKTTHGIIGYVMTGQIYESGSKSDEWAAIAEYLKGKTVDLQELKRVYPTKQRLSKKQVASAFNMLQLMTCYLYQNEKVVANKNTFAYKLDRFILDNVAEDIDVNMLCREFNYQKTTFYKITNELYGLSIMKHVSQLRIQMAKHLLSNTDLPIAIIATKVGIGDYNYFSKVFKKEAKCTPREFRKNSIQ